MKTFTSKSTKQEILEAQPYILNGRERKGGFLAAAGKELDAEKVQETRDQK